MKYKTWKKYRVKICVVIIFIEILIMNLKTPLQRRITQGNLLNWMHPGYGDCGRCHRVWAICKSHDTTYEEIDPKEELRNTIKLREKMGDKKFIAGIVGFGWGMFPLCEDCWKELTPPQRLPYYIFVMGMGKRWIRK